MGPGPEGFGSRPSLTVVERNDGYWPSPWPAEDGGARRLASPGGGRGLGLAEGGELVATSREAMVATMVVLREPGEVFLLCHSGGDEAVSWVERVDPVSLETVAQSSMLLGGRTWPGGIAAHADGSLYVVFGHHVHRLSADLEVLASRALPRDRPYNSFVVLPDGTLVTKDFAGALPSGNQPNDGRSSELLALAPGSLELRSSLALPEPSVARISAKGNDVYVVGDPSLLRVRWDGEALSLDRDFTARYLTEAGQTYGWDAVIGEDAAWFLDDGAGSEAYAGNFIGKGVSPSPLHLVRVDLTSGEVQLTEVCGEPYGLVANPPILDESRGIVVAYDSANGVLAGFDTTARPTPRLRWKHRQHHACHALRFAATGELVTADYDPERMVEQVVVRDIVSGEELGRVDTGSPIQSPVFMAAGFDRDLYYCSFTTLTRVSVQR